MVKFFFSCIKESGIYYFNGSIIIIIIIIIIIKQYTQTEKLQQIGRL